jgi:hypothetical protein
VLYFLIWASPATRILRNGERARSHRRSGAVSKIKARSAPALLVFVVTTTLAFIDWIMSLEPDWYSTIYGWMFTVGQVLLTFSFLVAVLVLLSKREPFLSFLTRQHYHDLGNLMLAFTMLWAYMSFAQFLIIWAENLPDEIPWYVRRFSGGWGYIAWTISIFHVLRALLPAAAALHQEESQAAARRWRSGSSVMRCWMYSGLWNRRFRQRGLEVYWTDIVALIGLGGIWLAFFIWQSEVPTAAGPARSPRHLFVTYRHGHGRTLIWNTRNITAPTEPAMSSAKSAYG